MKRFLGIANMIVVHKQSIISEMDVTLHYEVFTLLIHCLNKKAIMPIHT